MSALFYLMGPSGAGKDSLIARCRETLPHRAPIVFAHRYITRPVDAGGENHIALTPQEFSLREDHNVFCLKWDSHGLRYGIGTEVRDWLAAGLSVVVNGSRAYLDQATACFPALIPVQITVRTDVLRERLERRGRETADEIEGRLKRAEAFTVSHPRLISIDNSGPLDHGTAALMTALMTAPSSATVTNA